MLKFSCDKPELAAAVAAASRASASKSTIPSLEGLLLEAGENVVLSGYNLKLGIRTTLHADVEERGAIVLNAKLFGDIVRRLPSDTVTVTAGDDLSVEIVCGMSRFNILGTDANDYPELPSVDSSDPGSTSITLTEKVFKSMISETIFAISDSDARPVHTGSLFEVADDRITIVSVDGFRMALRREALSEPAPSVLFVVPGMTLSEAERLASDSENKVIITVSTRHIMITVGENELISRRLEGEFLDYKKAIPENKKYGIGIDRRELISSVERVSLIITEQLKSPVRCVFTDGDLTLSSVTAIGRANDHCSCSGDGEGLEIGFNNRYLLDALKAAPADELELQLTTGISPCVIVPRDKENDSFLYLILPVRLRAGE